MFFSIVIAQSEAIRNNIFYRKVVSTVLFSFVNNQNTYCRLLAIDACASKQHTVDCLRRAWMGSFGLGSDIKEFKSC